MTDAGGITTFAYDRPTHDLTQITGPAPVAQVTLGTWQHTLRAMADDLAVLAAETAENLSNSFPDVNERDVVALVTDEAAE